MCTWAMLKVTRRDLSEEGERGGTGYAVLHTSESNLALKTHFRNFKTKPKQNDCHLGCGVTHLWNVNVQRGHQNEMHTLHTRHPSCAIFSLNAYDGFYEHVITNFSEEFSLQNDWDLLRQYKLEWSNESLSSHASSFQTTNTASISAAQWKPSERLFYDFIKLRWYKYHSRTPHALLQLNIFVPTINSNR